MKGLGSPGFNIYGDGFLLNRTEKDNLLSEEPSAVEVVRPYFNGLDVTELISLTPRRWVIDFGDRTEQEARKWRLAFDRVEKINRPMREGLMGQIHQDCFWKFWDMRNSLRSAMAAQPRLLVQPRDSKYIVFRYASADCYFNDSVKLYFDLRYSFFGSLQSSIHAIWGRWRSTSKGISGKKYSTSSALDTFPLPDLDDINLEKASFEYHEARNEAINAYNLNLTSLYNGIHNPSDDRELIEKLRLNTRALDAAVCSVLDMGDIILDHGFHPQDDLPVGDNVRFMVSQSTREEIILRLVDINQKRHQQEISAVPMGGRRLGRATQRRPVVNLDPAQSGLDFGFSSPVNDPAEKILTVLALNGQWLAKGDVLAAASVTDGQWNAAISDLVSGGKVERQGERRGARYRIQPGYRDHRNEGKS